MCLHTALSRTLLLAFVAAIASLPANAQQGESSTPTLSKGRWRVVPAMMTETEFDNNVFLLAPGKRDDVGSPPESELTSGRYAGMKSASDVITTARGLLHIKGSGLGGETARITPSISYEFYALNAERRNMTAQLSIEQDLQRGARASVRARMRPSYFKRNYLVDAVDADADGSIMPEERLYALGVYRETEASAAYRLRLDKSTRKSPFGAKLDLSAGYYGRAYEAPFAARDIAGPTAGIGLLLDLTRRVQVDLDYELEMLRASARREVMLLDENDFGRDFNGNGSTDDVAARAYELADHSRMEHNLGGTARFDLASKRTLALSYSHVRRRHTSSQPYDANNGRRTSRNDVGVELGLRLTRGIRLIAAAETSGQSLNLTSDAAGTVDETDYKRQRAKLRLSYEF